MPLISRFYGISIYMYFDDHFPPHFHAIYGEFEVLISIEGLKIIAGKMPKRALNLINDWAASHVEELKVNWNHMLNNQPFEKIKPLE